MGARAAAFVDGLNLYHGLRDAALLKYRWLDVEAMVDSLAADAGDSRGSVLRNRGRSHRSTGPRACTRIIQCGGFQDPPSAQETPAGQPAP